MSLRLANGLKALVLARKASTLAATAQDVLAATNHSALTELSNGFRIASVENNRPVATIGVWIDAGSRYENNENNGISSLAEQVLYHGTASRTKAQLELDLAKIGARLNSYTTREQTAFYVQVPNAQVEQAVAILADVLRNSKLDTQAIETERQVLLRRLQDSENDHGLVTLDNLHATAFQGTPFGLSPLGSTRGLQNITREQLTNYVEDHIKPVRTVLAGVGGVSQAQLSKLGEKYFGDLSNNYERKISQNDSVRFTGSEFRYRDDNIPLLYGAAAVEGVPLSHPDALPLQLATVLVGQYSVTDAVSVNAPIKHVQRMSILKDLRSYKAFSINYNSTGLFGVQFVAEGNDMENVYQILRGVQRQWKHLATGVADPEVERVKNAFKADVLSVADDSTRLADRLGRDVLNTGAATDLAALERQIEALDASSIREAVSRHVYDRDLAVAGVGRTEAWPNYAQLRYGQSWWRI